ncbi:hypothetical protein Hanom_Chr09g00835851 [Helianthus anomalus]
MVGETKTLRQSPDKSIRHLKIPNLYSTTSRGPITKHVPGKGSNPLTYAMIVLITERISYIMCIPNMFRDFNILNRETKYFHMKWKSILV